MSTFVKGLLEERANHWEQQKALLDKAEAEGRKSLDAEEQRQYDERNAEIDRLDGQRQQIEADEKRAKDAAESLRAAGIEPESRGSGSDGEQRLAAEVRSFLTGKADSAELRASDTKWIDFNELRSGMQSRALSVGTATAGGNTVPRGFRAKLYEHLIEMSAVLSLGCEVWNTQSGETTDIPITTSHGSATLTTEGTAITGTEPAFGKKSIGAFKYGQVVYLSRELVDDTGVDLLGYIARAGGWAVGNALGADLVKGDGSSKPAGVAGSATVGVTGATSTAGMFTFDNLIDLYYSVIAPYRGRPTTGWAMKDTAMGAARKIKDNDGQYLWQPSLVAGTPDTLYGKPVRTDPNFDGTGLGKRSVFFGDWSTYLVRLVRSVRFERSDEVKFAEDQVGFKVVIRGDGVLQDQTGSIKCFVGGAS